MAFTLLLIKSTILQSLSVTNFCHLSISLFRPKTSLHRTHRRSICTSVAIVDQEKAHRRQAEAQEEAAENSGLAREKLGLARENYIRHQLTSLFSYFYKALA